MATDLLESAFGTKNILGLWRSKKIPQRGKITDDATYEPHGIGCRVYISQICIDFDYSTDGRIDGFDAWRLYLYACEVPKKHQKYTNKTTTEQEFSEYVAKGKQRKYMTQPLTYIFKALDKKPNINTSAANFSLTTIINGKNRDSYSIK